MYIDAHCHIASTRFIPRSFMEGVADNMLVRMRAYGVPATKKALLDMSLSVMQDHECDELAAQMAEAGIERSVLLLPDFTYALSDCELTIAEMFEKHRDVLVRHGERFYVFAGTDPRWGKDGIDLFERGLREYGFHGLKIYPPCGYSPSCPELYPYYEICAAFGCPVLMHTGATSPALSFTETRPLEVDKAARAFPSVNFILAHASSWNVEEALMMAATRPNIYLDFSGYAAFPSSKLSSFFAEDLNYKICFGTDWPVFRLQATQKELVSRLIAEDGPMQALRPRDREMIMKSNILRLLARDKTPARV